MVMKAAARRGAEGFTSVDEFLAAEGKLEQFEAIAIEEVLQWQAKSAAPAHMPRSCLPPGKDHSQAPQSLL